MKNLNFLSKQPFSLGSNPITEAQWKQNGSTMKAQWLRFVSILVLVLTIGVGNALGAADYTYTLASGDFTTSSHSKTSGTISWTFSKTSGTESYGWDNDYGFKFGSGKSSYPSAFKLTSSSFSSKIKKVVVTANVNSSKSCKLDVKVGSTTYGSQATINTKAHDTKEFSIADASTVNGAIELSFSNNNGPLYLEKVEVYYYSSSQEPSLLLDPTSVSVGATGVTQQTITLTASNFSPAVSTVTTGLYSNAGCTTPVTSGAWVKDIAVNNAKTQVTFNVDDNDGEARNVWLKITASNGTKSADAILPISQAKYEAPATLPFSFTGGKSDIGNTDGMSHSGLGNDYSSTANLRFDDTGDYVVIRFNAAPKELTYDIQGNSFSGGTFKVQTSTDGTAYTDLVSHTSLGSKSSEKQDLASTVRYVKFIYTNKSSGNVGLGNIGISKLPTTATVTYDLNGKTLSSGTKPGDVSNVTLNQEYTLPVSTLGATGYTFVGWNTNKNANSKLTTFTPTEATTYTLYAIWTPNTNTAYTVKHYKQNLDGTYPSSPTETDNLTGTTDASVTPARKSYTGFTAPNGQTVTILPNGSRVVTYNYTRNSYTLTWSTDGDALTGNYTSGSTKFGADITAPNTPTKTGYVFDAWSSTPAATMPAAATTYTATWTCKDPEIETDLSTAQVDYIKDVTATALTISASANGASLNYAWEKSANGTSGWSPVGTNSSSYTPSTAEEGDLYYRCIVTNAVAEGCSSATATSKVAHIHVIAPSVCLTPSFSPATDTYVGSQNVEISSTAGATIYYTTDGSDPKVSGTRSTYSSAIPVAVTTTIRAYAEKAEMTASAEGSATITIKCADPTFDPAEGSFTSTQNVSLASDYGTVYYTTDGSDPATNGTAYSTPIAVSTTNTTIKAIAKKANCANSDLAIATYTIACATPTFSPDGGTYTGTQNVTISSTDGATIYYTTDGTTPDNTKSLYSSAIPVSSNTTIKAIAVKDGLSQSAIGAATYSIKYTVTLNAGTGSVSADGWTESEGVWTKAQTAVGGSITLPDAALSSSLTTAGWSFAGWKISAVSPQTSDAQTFVNKTYIPTGDITLYAVYQKTTGAANYELVESNLGTAWAGDYLIAYSDGVFADGRTAGTDGLGKASSAVDPGDNLSANKKVVAASWGDTYNVTLEEISENSNTYFLKTKDGKYNYYTTNSSNGLSNTDNKNTADDYPISVVFSSSSDVRLSLGGGATGSVFRWNNATTAGGGQVFRFYKNCTQSAVYLYKKGEGAKSYYSNPSDQVTLTYDANGATAGEAPTVSGTITIGTSVTVVAKPNDLVKTGYTFGGWNTKDDGTGTNYENGTDHQSFTINDNTTLYAKWSKNNYTVKVTAPGNGNEITAPENNASVEYDAKVTLTYSEAEHWSFTSWTVTKDGDAGTTVDLTDEGEGVYSFNMPDYDVAISATFTEDDKVTVTWHVNYGTSETANIYVNTPFSQLSAPVVADNAVPTCANKFMGWATAVVNKDNATSSNVSWADETNVSNSNKDFYAVWATGSASSTSFVKLGDNEDSYLVQGAKIAIVNNKNDKILGSDFAETAATHPDDDDNKLTVTATQVWTLVEQDEYDYWKLTCGNVQLGTNNVASSGGSSEDIGNYTNDYSWWGLSSNTEWDNKVSGCYYMFNWYNNTYYNFLEYNGSKWVSYYAADVTSGNKSYYAMKLYKPATDYSNYITNCCLPVENALTITNANQVATGSTLTLSSTGGNSGTVVWSVVNGTGSATISEGVLTGGNLGTVTLKAHQNANGNYCATDAEDMTVTIVEATVPVTSVSLNHTTAALLPGETIQLNATLTPGNATDQTIGWVSGTPAKATVSNAGLVTAVAKGTSTVTATANGGDNITATCAVTVYGLTILKQDEDGETISAGVTATATGKSLSASAGETQYVFKGWKYAENGDGGLDAIANASNASITLTGTPTGDVTIIAEFYKPVTITWLVDGEDAATGSQTLSVARGTLWSALTPAAEPAGNALGSCADAFVGWSNLNSELRGNGHSAPAVLFRNAQISSYDTEITDPITFRAVFATSAQGATFDGEHGGQFYIYALVGETKYYATTSLSSGKLASTTSVAEAALFTFTKHATESGKFSITVGDNYYAHQGDNTNLKTQAAEYWWTIGNGTKGTWRVSSNNTGRGWIYRASTYNVFGGYSAGGVTLVGTEYYDLEIAGAASYSNYVTVCCTPHSVTVNGNDESENKTVSADVEETCDGMTVNLSRNTSCTHYTFNEWVITYTDGEGEHTINVEEDENHSGSFTMPAYDVTVEGDWSPINYKVTIASAANGSATVKEDYATDEQGRWLVPYGSTVTLQATPSDAEAYYFTGWTLSPDKDVQKSLAELPITMTGSFTATPSFAPVVKSALTLGSAEGVYSLSATLANGDLINDMSKIKSGTALKVTYALSGQNEYVGWTFSVGGIEQAAENNTVTFAMPAEALTVSLNTRPYYLLNLSAEHGSITGVSIAGQAQDLAAQYIVHEDEVVILTAAPENENYKFKEWTGADVNANGQFTVGTSDLDVAAVFELKNTYTLTLMALGREQEKIEDILEGESIWEQIDGKEAPEITGQLFMGWSLVEDDKDMIISEDVDIEIGEGYTTLYAVYQAMTPCYVKVTSTSDIKNGKYLIVYETGGLAFNGGLGYDEDHKLDDSGNTISVEINTVGDYKTIAISDATTAAEFTIASVTGGHSIKSASGKYIGRTGDSNGLNENTETVYTNTLSINNDGNFVCVGSGGAYMRYNSDANQERFRYFKSSTYTSQKAIQLYKRAGIPNDAGETASIPTVTITTPVNADEIYPDGKAGNIVIEDGGSININTDVELNDITVKSGATVTVSEAMQANDMTVEIGGILDIAEDKTTEVNNLYISSQSGASAQVTHANQVQATGVFMDVKLCDDNPLDADYWYSIAVPFDVDLNSGVFQADGSPMTNRVDFEVWGFSTQLRAQTQSNGWQRVSDNMMHAGKAYLIGFNAGQTNIIRLKAAPGWKQSLFSGNSMSVVNSGSGDHDNWNGLANPTMRYIDVNKDAQAFNNNTHRWDSYALDADRYNFVVGTAFFVQSASAVTISNTDHGNYRAPKRESENKCAYAVRITRDEADEFDNQIIVRATDEATGEYTQGHDMLTMNNTTAPSAMLWTENYGGKRLAIEEAAWLNGTASYVLKMYAPKAGTYSISVASVKENADLYLTYEGAIIWNLSMGAYELSLSKGTTSGYGLLLQAKAPGVATGVDEIGSEKAGVQKIVLEDKVFILRGGKMYDVTGKTVK